MNVRFQSLKIDEVPWGLLDGFTDRLIFQTKPWLDFLVATQNADPVVLKIYQDKDHVGYFTGMIFRKMGIPILGSPFPGWTTMYMGFNLYPGVSRKQLLEPLLNYT